METLPNLSPSSEMESAEQQKPWQQQEEAEEVVEAEQQKQWQQQEETEEEEEVVEAEQQKQWQQQEETEEDAEEVVALQVRRPRWWKTTATITTTTTTTTIGGSDVSSGDVMLPTSEPTNGFQEEGYDYPQEELQNGSNNKEGNDVQEDSQESLARNVHYDKDQGIWKCRKCIWTYESGSPWIDHSWRSKWHALMLMNAKTVNQGGQCFYCETEGTESNYRLSVEENSGIQGSASEKNPGDKGLVVTINIFDSQKSQDTVNNQQYKENLKDDSFSDFKLLSSEKSPEDDKTNNSFSEITAGDEIELVNDIDEELTEFDVERVLEKQNTHDLYCPNCNSCITRRVILHKRKRKVKVLGEDAKRNKVATVVASELDSNPATNDQDSYGQTPVADDCNRPREREIFSCLSCFSIFIPTGKGFKLFKIFGDKSEKDNIPSPQPILAVKNKRFSSILVSRKEDMLIEQRNGHKVDVIEKIVRVSKQEVTSSADVNENIVGATKQEVTSPPQSFGAQGLEKSNSSGENREGGDDIVRASTLGSKVSGKVVAGVGEKSVDAMKNGKDDTKPVSVPEESDNNETENIVPDLPSANRQKVGAVSPTASVVTSPPQSFGAQGLEKSSSSGENRQVGDDIVPASTPGSKLSGKVIAGVGEKSVDAMKNGKVSMPGESDNNETVNIVPDLPSANGQKVGAIFPTGSVVEGKNVRIEISGTGSDTIIIVQPDETAVSQDAHDISTQVETEISPTTESVDTRGFQGVEIIKSMVYGGLIESITSLGVVSSAAGAGATTLNIVALGMANLIGGLLVIGHHLWDLKNDYSARTSNQVTEGVSYRVSTQEDRYQDLLGRRENFWIHAVVAILSFLMFGSLPPIIYGFSFHASANRDYKLLAVAAASLLCIIILTVGKVYTQPPPKSYIKTVIYFVSAGFMASGVSYAAGQLINKLLENLGWSGSGQVLTLPVLETTPVQSTWQSY